MKKIIILFINLIIVASVVAQEDNKSFNHISINNWNAKIIGLNNFYPTYLADPLGIRFEISSQKILYSDFDFQDKINDGNGYLGKLVVNPGVRMSLLKFTPKNNPKLGIEVDLGMTIPTFMRAGNHDVIGLDGIYYFAIAANPTEWLSLRFSKHHICTHIGDEYPSGTTNSVIDYDPTITQLPVRDDFIISAAIKPLYFLKKPQWDILRVYGDFGFYMPGVDFMGSRQNKPHKNAYINLQAGAEIEYYFSNQIIGGIFLAGNISAYQLNAFSPNLSLTGGYILPQTRDKRKLRIGFNYYNGRSLSNQFYNRKEKFFAFIVAMDI